MCQGMDYTRPLNLSCGIWHQDPLSYEAGPPWIGLDRSIVANRCSIGLRSWKAKATPRTLCHVPQTIPELFLPCFHLAVVH